MSLLSVDYPVTKEEGGDSVCNLVRQVLLDAVSRVVKHLELELTLGVRVSEWAILV